MIFLVENELVAQRFDVHAHAIDLGDREVEANRSSTGTGTGFEVGIGF